MANVCSFEMKVKGTKENCLNFANSQIHCYELYIEKEYGTDEDFALYITGECRWSVTGSMVNTDEDDTLAAKAKKFNIELEVFGYDISEPEWVEHYHYKGAEVIREYNLPPVFMEWQIDEADISEEDKAKYEYKEEHRVYVIKPEFEEKFEWNEDEQEMTLFWDIQL